MNLRDGHYGEFVLTNRQSVKLKITKWSYKIEKNLFFLFGTLQDEEEPQDTQYQIDGAYIPRIFILGKPKKFPGVTQGFWVWRKQGSIHYL